MPYFDQYGPQWDQTSPNAARDYGYMIDEAGAVAPPGQDIFSRLFRSLFGGGKKPDKITSQELPPIPGYDQYNGPFGGAPQPKPATQISSSDAITARINRMLGPPPAPPPIDPRRAFGVPADFNTGMQPGAESGGPPGYENPNRIPMADFNFGPLPAQNAPMPPMADFNFGPLPARNAPVNMRTIPGMTRSPFGMTVPGVTGAVRRADGGAMPGYRRGGYPQLYSQPVRSTFDSGGESFVGSHYGDSSGRADDVNARLSPKEYVIDAETMALLGDGNPDHGAKKMDQFRANIRKQKGKKLAKGKISPNAKPVTAYIAGNPMGDGMRRSSRKGA